MTELTIPGTIPGLLRRGSPVVPARLGAWVESHSRGCVSSSRAQALVRDAPWPGAEEQCVHLSEGWGNTRLTDVALDLTDATGRVHAAWWLESRVEASVVFSVGVHPAIVILCAKDSDTMVDEDIKILRDAVLRVAGISDNG